jgi:hypothetical protein
MPYFDFKNVCEDNSKFFVGAEDVFLPRNIDYG